MPKSKKILVVILAWQYVWAILSLAIIIVRSINGMIWTDLLWENPSLRPDTFIIIMFRGSSVFLVLFVLISATSCFGLIKKQDWGRQLSIISMGFISFFGIAMLILVIIWYVRNNYDQLPGLIALVLAALAIILSGLLSLLYLTNHDAKTLLNK